ncbi:gliding motility-associated C-terminal domain-containing protein [Fulvivirgaceae bacterium BMA12]|uniref:Gliding motility-associated C-terminal domain-containing protein n=1 Tax=Agaribacillus aureus TaxID=3051825 RepID=A0ABT8LHH4_9BACT|nr:gliding motility-associated C-terminal domain-containing protein [Fulvivirgaceae bacterium BMA12]
MKCIAMLNKEISGAPPWRVLLIVFGWMVFNTAEAQVPTAPDNFYILRHDGQNELIWSANPGAENVTDYTVYRSLDKINFASVATIAATPTPQYLDNDVENGVTYFYHLTATNASGEGPTSLIDASVPGADFGKFMQFNGVGANDSITLRNCDELQFVDQSYTMELWIRIKRLPLIANEAHLVTRYTNAPTPVEAYTLRILNSGQLEFRSFSGNTTKLTTNTLNEREWYHLALSFENTVGPVTPTTNVSIYINGVLATEDASGTTAFGIVDPNASPGGVLVIGGVAVAGPNFFEGYMSELRIWDGVRTPAEIVNNSCTMLSGDEAGLLGLWRFEEEGSSAPMVYDYSPNGNDGGEDVQITDFTPEAVNDLGNTVEDTAQDINIQNNDVSFSERPLVGNLLPGYPLSGSAVLIDNDSSITYTPDPGFYGVDTVKYVLSDTAVFCNTTPERDTAMVLVQVQCGRKDTLNWNSRPLMQAANNQRFIEKGLISGFRVDDPDNIQVGLATGNDFQNVNSMVWKQDPSTNTQAISTILSFNRSVDQFCLEILDIDSNPGVFTDSVVINGYRDGNIVDINTGSLAMGAAVNAGGNNSFYGNANVDDISGNEGNLSVCFYVPLDSVQVIFTSTLTAPANPSEQGIGIGNFTWCAFPNNPPVIQDDDGIAVDSLFFTIAPDSLLNICLTASDVDVDSLFISSIGTLSDGGRADGIHAIDTCLTYSAAANFTGSEHFRVTVCDNRPDQLCDEVVIMVTTVAAPPPPPPPPPEPEPEPEPEGIFISQALSPNGDRILDHWEITGIEQYPNCLIKVFNIWGDLIFHQVGYDNQTHSWRGQTSEGNTFGGSTAPDGTYFYIIRLGDSQPVMKGYVVLKR